MRYCQGFGAVFELLKNNDSLTSSLTTADWQWLAVMKAYESMRSSDVMPREVREISLQGFSSNIAFRRLHGGSDFTA